MTDRVTAQRSFCSSPPNFPPPSPLFHFFPSFRLFRLVRFQFPMGRVVAAEAEEKMLALHHLSKSELESGAFLGAPLVRGG